MPLVASKACEASVQTLPDLVSVRPTPEMVPPAM